MSEPTTAADRQAAKLKASIDKLAEQTKKRAELWKMPRTGASTSSTTFKTVVGSHPQGRVTSHPRIKKEWPTCNECNNQHDPSSCFLADKVALSNFLKGKSQKVKDYWTEKVSRFEHWKAEHQAFLERVARRALNEQKHKEFLEREAKRAARRALNDQKHKEFLERQAKREAREAELKRSKTAVEKKAEHQRCVWHMIHNGGGFGRP